MTELVGRNLGRYEVIDRLGGGGMGEVYRARDTQLGRDVAVKVLPDSATDRPKRRERFEREAMAVAQLSHPNVLEIYDFGIDDGQVYAVTELLEGKDLYFHLRKGPLPLRRALEIAVDIAEGLGAAHAKGVIHRDIKPSNIFITSSGTAKVLDFGLARMAEPPTLTRPEQDAATLTGEGAVVGTVGYMSPEQVRGDPVDARTDIFSFGCVLYEMFTGVKPFRRDSTLATLHAIVNDDPQPPSSLNPDLPTAVDHIVERCLAKDRDERFESARDIAFALRALSGSRSSIGPLRAYRLRRARRHLAAAAVGAALVAAVVLAWQLAPQWLPTTPPLPEQKHLAVMQFDSATDDGPDRWLALGLGEVLARNLSFVEEQQRGGLWIQQGSPVRTYPSDKLDRLKPTRAVTIAIEGEVEHDGSVLRARLELVDPGTGRVLRTLEVDSGLANLGALQLRPIEAVASELGIGLADVTRDRITAGSTNITEAMTSYLQGLGSMAVDPPDLEQTITQLERATRADPLFGPAWTALARARLAASDGGDASLEGAIDAARRAVAAGNDPGEAEATLSALLDRDGRFEEALAQLEKAVRVRPDSGELYLQLGTMYRRAGRNDDAERAYQRSIFLRPTYGVTYHYLADLYRAEGRYEASATAWGRMAELLPEHPTSFSNLGVAYHRLGRIDEAIAMFEKSLELQPEGNSTAVANLGTLYFEDARYTDAIEMFEQAAELRPDDYLRWGYLAHACRWGGEPERTAEAFGRAIELAEPMVAESPDDPALLAQLAGYYVEVGRRDEGLALMERAAGHEITDPNVMVLFAETWEDLDERDRALEWIGRAFDAGVLPHRIESHPAMRDLIADPTYAEIRDSMDV